MSEVIQYTYRFMVPKEATLGDWAVGLVEHRQKETQQRFAEELMLRLAKNGGIVGPIHETFDQRPDEWFNTDTVECTHSVYAHFTELPEPETYRMMGGPADGRIVRTGGVRIFRMPYLEPFNPRLFDISEPVAPKYLEYEREGDTQVYLFKGIY